MDNQNNINHDLFQSIEKLQLIQLIKEVELSISFFEKKYHIHEYLLNTAMDEKPARIFKKKYQNWLVKVRQLQGNYEKAFQDYLEECAYYDELVQLLDSFI